MKLKTLLFFMAYFLMTFCLASKAYADMIEVKGKGVMTGKILKEDGSSVTFKDDYNQTIVYPRSDVTFLEKQKKAEGWIGGKHPGASGFKRETKSFRDFSLPFQDKISDVSDQVNAVNEKVSQKILDFLTEDIEDMKVYLQSVANRPEKIIEDIKRACQGKNHVLAYAGTAILALGILAAIIFGFKVIWIAFREGFLWGLAFLGNSLVIFSNRMGASIGLILLVPHLVSFYFILSHWRSVRKPVVIQIFCIDLMVLGSLLIKIAF